MTAGTPGSRAARFLRIGLTGGIASGKTAVAALFKARGIPVIDADQLVRELSAPGGLAHEAIIARFGSADKKFLRERIYSDPVERRALEAILHPLVHQESARRIQEVRTQGAPGVVYEAALLIEANRTGDFDEVVVVTAPIERRLERLMARDKISREQAMAILGAQLTDDKRLRYATQVIRNEGDLSALGREVDRVLRDLGVG